MNGFRLRLKEAPELRVDMRAVTPDALAALTVGDVERLRLGCGKTTLALGDLFNVEAGADGALSFEGDLSRFDRVGWRMTAGSLVVDGPVGDYAGACMTGGTMRVDGHARQLAACEMTGGELTIAGNVGDFAAATLPGSMDGMRGGRFIVRGDAGERFADRMRRGTAIVVGNVGAFAASRLVAGTIAIGGSAGAHVGYGMRRGSVIFAGAAPAIAPSFVPAVVDPAVFWQLLARDVAKAGGPFEGLAKRPFKRHLGDLAADGKGELILVG